MNAEPKHDTALESSAEPKKKSFSIRSDMARGLRVRTGVQAGHGKSPFIDNNGQPQRDGTWG
jgi:hypothetical protein